jgi:N-acyl homoserine lactone hydrolase
MKGEGNLTKSVTVVSTGSGEVHPEHIFGTRKPALWWIFTSRKWVSIPINVFVIEHADGLVLFDTGMDRSVVTNPDYFPDKVTALFMRRIFRFHQGPEDTLTQQLAAAGYRAGEVRLAVMSHLHFDHAGGISEIPQAELLVSQDAWDHMLGRHPEREGVLKRDIDVPGARWRRIVFSPTADPALAPFDRAYDVMGDGSMVLLPTPGHLPGSVSMLVRMTGAPPVLLIGDLAYSVAALERGQIPGTGDKEELRDSYDKVRALKVHLPGLVVASSHDAEAARALEDAM